VIVDRSISIAAPAEETFQRVLDIPFVGACLAGAKDIVEDQPGVYSGRFSVKVGPVRVTLQGTVRVLEVNGEERQAVLRLAGSDRGIGGNVAGDMRIRVVERSELECDLLVHTDVTISGKLGQFGQAVIVKKTDQITKAFVEEFSRQLAKEPVPAGADVAGMPAILPPAPVEVGPPNGTAVRAAAVAAPAMVVTGTSTSLRTLSALFRRGRHLVVVRGPEDVEWALRAGDDLGALWSPDGTNVGTGGRRTVPRVVEIQAGSVDDLLARLRHLDTTGPGAPAAIAVVPRGAAVADPAMMAELCGGAGDASRLPVVLVAGTPWTALLAARVASTGVAHGIAVVPNHASAVGAGDACVAAMVAEAVAEVRSAGLELPIIAGPVPDGRPVANLLSAGADGVLVAPARRSVVPFVGQRLRARRRGPGAWRG
jgi:carbon monoxide dehydrogenase subunit G